MNNLLAYCGLPDARLSASENDLPVFCWLCNTQLQKWAHGMYPICVKSCNSMQSEIKPLTNTD